MDRNPTGWVTLLSRSPLALFTALGVILYSISRGGYQVLYSEYGVAPEEVGLDYTALLSRQALPVAALIVVLAALMAPIMTWSRRTVAAQMDVSSSEALLAELQSECANRRDQYERARDRLAEVVNQAATRSVGEVSALSFEVERLRSELEQTEKFVERATRQLAAERRSIEAEHVKSRFVRNVWLLGSAGVVLLAWVIWMFWEAAAAGPGAYSPSLPVSPIQVEVQPTDAFWLTDDDSVDPVTFKDLGIADECSEGMELLYLGEASSIYVLYEACSGEVVRLPTDAVYLA